jgi:C-terminal processing protease CtpA/Prc
LTSDASFSGADVFAMVMKELPHVTIMGDHTSGQFSNMYEKKLPNGWKYTFSNQRYYSARMICYEGKGIEPDIKIRNTMQDIKSGEDSIILKALNNLNE